MDASKSQPNMHSMTDDDDAQHLDEATAVTNFVAWMKQIAPPSRSNGIVSVTAEADTNDVHPSKVQHTGAAQRSTGHALVDQDESFMPDKPLDPRVEPSEPTDDTLLMSEQVASMDCPSVINACNTDLPTTIYDGTATINTLLSQHKREAQSRVARHTNASTLLNDGTCASQESTAACSDPAPKTSDNHSTQCYSEPLSPSFQSGVTPSKTDACINAPFKGSPVATNVRAVCSPIVPLSNWPNNAGVDVDDFGVVGQLPLREHEVAYGTVQASDLFSRLTTQVAAEDDSNVDTSSPTVVVTPSDRQLTAREDRTHAKQFSSWGTPALRNKSPSQVRKLVLRNMPPNVDFTFLQSLIHTGAIETMTMSPICNTAYVMFTSGDSCLNYYDSYPNGLEIKHHGRKWTIFIEKGAEVDVVSGILQGQLDCGASRVVRASGADDEWTMRALRNIAAGPKDTRRVEAIIDAWRNGTRIIDFRFCDIADAVAFRSKLKRDNDWLDCTISFATDPCETATGVHFD